MAHQRDCPHTRGRLWLAVRPPLPAWAWQRDEVRESLRRRDLRALRLTQRYAGARHVSCSASHRCTRRQGITSPGTRRVRALLLDPESPAAHRRAQEIGESLNSFAGGVHLSVARLTELAEHTGVTVEVYLYGLLPTWRVISLDGTMFISAFGEDSEVRTSPMYKITTSAYRGALHRGFRRFVGELRRTSRRVV